MNLLLITSSYPDPQATTHSGGGVFVEHFARELAKGEHVVVLTQQVGRKNVAGAGRSGLEIIRFPWNGRGKPLSNLKLPRDFRLIASVMCNGFLASLKAAKKHEIDHTLAIWALPSGIWALGLKLIMGIPYATWSLGSDIWNYKGNFFSRMLLRIILHEADKCYADGYQLKSDVESIARKRCKFLSTSRYLPDKIEKKACVKPDRKNYLFIGRYHPNKGPDVLLKAIAKLSPVHDNDVHFHLFGEGYLKPELEDFIEKNQLEDIVSLNGYIEERLAVAYLTACDALIIPSRIESIPVVLSDALKTGSKIIATDVGDMGYLLKKFRAGVVVPPQSPEKLADVIENELAHETDPFAEGRKALLDLFDISNTVRAFVSDLDSTSDPADSGGGFEQSH
ncbi:MAG: glycosyltransferase [Deltaproteobacteria bacterium]|nr:glycosyltransferase [Deltaproteobacteria bacterium]